MNLSTKAHYGLIAVIDIAIHQGKGPVPLGDIVKRRSISLSYLEQIVSVLRKCRILESFRGPGGGYILARTTPNINALDVVVAIEGRIDFGSNEKVDPYDGKNSAKESRLARKAKKAEVLNWGAPSDEKVDTQNLWDDFNKIATDYLSSQTIEKMILDGELSTDTPTEASISSKGIYKVIPIKVSTNIPNSVFDLGRISKIAA